MHEAQVIVTGNVANKPTLGTTPGGVSVASMRLGYTPRRLDRESGQWVDGQTSWVTVKCWRKLADHVAMSLTKGDPVVVKGVIQVRQFTDKDGNPRQATEVLASAVGHDLNRGLTHFIREVRKPAPVGGQGDAAAGSSGQPGTAAADGDASGSPAGVRSATGPGWDPARAGAGADPDGDMFDESAVAAAALHAVPEIEDGGGAGQEPTVTASGPGTPGTAAAPRPGGAEAAPASGPGNGKATPVSAPGAEDTTAASGRPAEDAASGPGAEHVTGGTGPSGPEAAGVPAQRKPGSRQARHGGGTGGGNGSGKRDAAAAPREPSLT